MSDIIVNKVAESGIVTIDPASLLPSAEIITFDIKDFLFMGLILKEKDFREALKNTDWQQYAGKQVALTCTADAIIPAWAWMLIMTYLQPVATDVVMGDETEARRQLFLRNIQQLETSGYTDKRIVIKGCGDTPIADFAYMELTKKLLPVARSIMFGEPCSTVPVYKKR
ncbi:MAG: DUF2480 family protein [Chitinophagaceae bacterium]|nr:DUF2480 family protein [Chitinophagaceae bacterium]